MMQYYADGADACAANRLFTQYHAQYPSYEQERILKEVVKSNSVICLLLLLSEWESTVLTFVELFTLVLQEPWRNIFKKQAGQAEMEILLML